MMRRLYSKMSLILIILAVTLWIAGTFDSVCALQMDNEIFDDPIFDGAQFELDEDDFDAPVFDSFAFDFDEDEFDAPVLDSDAFNAEVSSEDMDETEDDIRDEIETPEKLLQIADEKYFQRVGFSQTFWEAQGYLNEVLDGGIIHQYYVRDGMGTDLLLSMFPAERTVRTGNLRLDFHQAWERDYHVTLTVLRTENVPGGSGGDCWIRYSNVQTKSSGSESGLILFPGREAYGFVPAGNDEELIYTPVADLSALNLNNSIKFDFIRLDGVSYIYANGKFLFSYEDGFDGNMSFEAGAELFEGGNRVRCDFDDFSMSYR